LFVCFNFTFSSPFSLILGEYSLKRSSRFSGGKNEGKDVFELTVPSKELQAQVLASFGQRPEEENRLAGKQVAISEISNCFTCGKSGHKSNTCQDNQEKKGRRDNKYGPKTATGARCYNCQQTGHLAKLCPNETVPRPEKKKEITGLKKEEAKQAVEGGEAMQVEAAVDEKKANSVSKKEQQPQIGKDNSNTTPSKKPNEKKPKEKNAPKPAANNTNNNNNNTAKPGKGSTPKKRIGA
jgi:hypothetical protein